MLLFFINTIITAIYIYYLFKKWYFIDTVFEAVITISNTGLTIGVTTIELDFVSKIIFTFNMIMKRFKIIGIM